MSETQYRPILFLGGPLHGQHRLVPIDEYRVKIPVPADAVRDTETGVPILGLTVRYVRRKLEAEADGVMHARSLFVDEELSPEAASRMLGDLLTRAWVLQDDE